ncbi:hypothetical protein FJTKL_06846 [Diaporthe vaccinii]|uniref:Secreted protein n=1 Tax=Diaporthe vaccinii TaxID=105482 RepID=A0ABR4EVQ0_9PEZI
MLASLSTPFVVVIYYATSTLVLSDTISSEQDCYRTIYPVWFPAMSLYTHRNTVVFPIHITSCPQKKSSYCQFMLSPCVTQKRWRPLPPLNNSVPIAHTAEP